MEAAARHVLRAAGGGRLFRARNSLIRSGLKETLSTREQGRLTWYACGPTVYDDAHLGHARTYVSFDIARRVLSALARVDIDFALGVTDVDDKILARAAEARVAPQAIARRFEARFFADLAALNVLPPTRVLRVTEHVPQIVDYIAALVADGTAYAVPGGDVYFSVPSAGPRYGQLDASRAAGAEEGAGSATDEEEEGEEEAGAGGAKRDARDFALWKAAGGGGETDAGRARWASPWGPGRPGWHVECAAMARGALGDRLDVHSGGIDLRFPHHTNELALAEAAGCCGSGAACARWVHTWLHAGHVRIAGRKMSKSLKNFVSVRDFLAGGGDPDAFRVFCLLHRYAAPVEFAPARVADAAALLARLRRFVAAARAEARQALAAPPPAAPPATHRPSMHPLCAAAQAVDASARAARAAIEEALVDDFDTPSALSAISELVAAVNRTRARQSGVGLSGALLLARARAADIVADTLGMFGVSGMGAAAAAGAKGAGERDAGGAPKEAIDAIVALRSEVRRAASGKNLARVFDACDAARDRLRNEFGVEVLDAKDGSSSWAHVANGRDDGAARTRRQDAARRASAEALVQD